MPSLQPGETLLRTGAVVWVGPQGPPRPGTLSVTNHALIFEGPTPEGWGGPPRPMGPGPFRGPGPGLRPGMRPGVGGPPGEPGVLRIPLWRCRGASVVSTPQGPGLHVQLLQRQIVFTAEGPEQWASVITQARATAPPPPPGAMGGGPGGPRGPPNPGAMRAAMPRCGYCGQLSAVSATKCEHCGAPF